MAKKQASPDWKREIRRQVTDALQKTSSGIQSDIPNAPGQIRIPPEPVPELRLHPAVRTDIRFVLILSLVLALAILVTSWLDQHYDLLERLVDSV